MRRPPMPPCALTLAMQTSAPRACCLAIGPKMGEPVGMTRPMVNVVGVTPASPASALDERNPRLAIAAEAARRLMSVFKFCLLLLSGAKIVVFVRHVAVVGGKTPFEKRSVRAASEPEPG